MERGGGAAAVPFEDPLWNFKRGGGAGGVRPLWPSLKTLFGISKGGARASANFILTAALWSCLLTHPTLLVCFQADLFAGAVFIETSLKWNLYAAVVLLLAIAALFTITGR